MSKHSVVALENDWLGIAKATPEQWVQITRAMSYYINLDKVEGLQERCERVLDNLDILQPCEGCVPEGFTDELELSIIRKFRIHYRMAVTLAAAMLGGWDQSMIDVVVEPSYDDTSTIVVVHTERHRVLRMVYRKAWNFEYDSLETMLAEVQEDASLIAELWKEV